MSGSAIAWELFLWFSYRLNRLKFWTSKRHSNSNMIESNNNNNFNNNNNNTSNAYKTIFEIPTTKITTEATLMKPSLPSSVIRTETTTTKRVHYHYYPTHTYAIGGVAPSSYHQHPHHQFSHSAPAARYNATYTGLRLWIFVLLPLLIAIIAIYICKFHSNFVTDSTTTNSELERSKAHNSI